ncbi:hypothetical protein [Streptomyces sp. NPDC002346]
MKLPDAMFRGQAWYWTVGTCAVVEAAGGMGMGFYIEANPTLSPLLTPFCVLAAVMTVVSVVAAAWLKPGTK